MRDGYRSGGGVHARTKKVLQKCRKYNTMHVAVLLLLAAIHKIHA